MHGSAEGGVQQGRDGDEGVRIVLMQPFPAAAQGAGSSAVINRAFPLRQVRVAIQFPAYL